MEGWKLIHTVALTDAKRRKNCRVSRSTGAGAFPGPFCSTAAGSDGHRLRATAWFPQMGQKAGCAWVGAICDGLQRRAVQIRGDS